jgi:hypothetical protein
MDDIFAKLSASTRPLVICDIDEVVLEFLDPFHEYLQTVSYRLHPDSYRLTGNIRSIADGAPATQEMIREFEESFFAAQDIWQRPARDAKLVLDSLGTQADIIFLTAMPPRHQTVRRTLLDSLDIRFPMIATEEAKGPIAAQLIGTRGIRSAFIDDIHTNHHSVRANAPDCKLISLAANETFRALAPHPGDDVVMARDWQHAGELIRSHFQTMP